MTRRIAFGGIATAALVAGLTLGFAQTTTAQQGAAGTGAVGAGAAGANPAGVGAAGASPAGPGAGGGAARAGSGGGGAGLEASPGKAGPAAKAAGSAGSGPDSQSAESPANGAGRSGEPKPSAQQSGEMQGNHPRTDAQTTGDRNKVGGAGDTHRSTTSQINTEQQTRVHAELAHTHIREAPNLNVNLQIGATAPRTITEYWEPVPPTIINIVPGWSSYRVIRVGNEILIIEPDTFAVVAVIEG